MPIWIRLLSTAALLLFGRAALAGLDVNVNISGVEGRLLDNVRSYLSIVQQKNDRDLTVPELRRLNIKADNEIRQALKPFGYYHPKIDKSLSRQGGTWVARYDIQKGPPVRISRVDLAISGDGKDDPAFQADMDAFPLHKGDVLDQPSYESAKNTFQTVAAERGYFDFKFSAHRIAINLDNDTAAVTLHLNTGPRYRFGQVTFEQDFLKDSLLQRYVPFKPGEPYSTNKLLDLNSALTDTPYFSRVDIQAEKHQTHGLETPIIAKLAPAKRNRYSIGAGYGTDTGARLKLGWDIRRVNRSGHHLSTVLQLSQIENTFRSSYIIPIRDPRTDSLSLNASLQTRDIADIQDRILAVGPSRTISRHSGWVETDYIDLKREIYTVGDEHGTATLLVPGTTWTWVRASGSRVYTRHGERVLIDVRGSHPALGSRAAFIQARLDTKLIRGITDYSRLILRGNFGFTHTGDFATLPPSYRFFAGGDQSVRGYNYMSLGPHNAAGYLVGGNQLVVGSVEVDHVIVGNWSAAVFYDIGNALNDFSTPLKQGTGFGLRWRSPIGMLRLDLAFALSTPGTPSRLHFTVGPDL